MKTVFIIGGMGSGKSTVASQLEELGAFRIDLDKMGHRVLSDESTQKELIGAFGPNILNRDGTIDRKTLAAEAFVDAEAHQKLNAATIPRIAEMLAEDLGAVRSELPQAIVVIEASSYDGPHGSFSIIPDEIVAVEAPEELRCARAVEAGFSEGDVRLRMTQQPTDEDRRRWATRVITNAGSLLDLQKETKEFWEELT